MLRLSSGDSATYHLVATLPNSTTIKAGCIPPPSLPSPQPAAAGDGHSAATEATQSELTGQTNISGAAGEEDASELNSMAADEGRISSNGQEADDHELDTDPEAAAAVGEGGDHAAVVVVKEALGYVQVVTPAGLLVEMDTEGRVVMGPVTVEGPKVGQSRIA